MIREEFYNTVQAFKEKQKNQFSFMEKRYMKLKKPLWAILTKDELFDVYKDQWKIYNNGELYIGTIVQANTKLFEADDKSNCPAAILYSKDEAFLDKPYLLKTIATELFSYKDKEVDDEEIKVFSDAITDERTTLLNLKLPISITEGREVYYTSVVFHREHIPNGYIDRSFYPIIVNEEYSANCIIMPEKFITEDLKEKLATL